MAAGAAFEYFWNKGRGAALEQPDVCQLAGECVGEGVVSLTAFAQVSGGAGSLEVAPALERAFGGGRDAGDRGVKYDAAAADTVVADHFIEANDRLAAEHQAFEDPIE